MTSNLRLKFRGGVLPIRLTTRDDGEFKEGEHPRAGNGQFTSGGGAGGKQVHGGVTAPKKGSAAHNIWSYAALCEEQGKPVTAANVVASAEAAGVTLNKSNTSQTIPLYKKFQKSAKESGAAPVAPAPAPAKPKLENNAETFVAVSIGAGLKKEGVYQGITYYKNDEGLKVSYSETLKSYQIKKPDGSNEFGTDLNELAEKLKVDPVKAAAESKLKAAKQAAETAAQEAQAKAQAAAAHSTLNAALYGHKAAVKGTHQYSSKGAANEAALSSSLRASLSAYTGSSYKPINKAMRFATDASEVDAETMKNVFNLHQAFRAVPPTTHDIDVGRKVGIEALKTMARDAGINHLDDLQPGTVLRDTGIISTSHSKSVWSGDVKFDIHVPKGSKAIDLSETMNKGEQEMLLPPGSGLKIKSIKKSALGAGYHITCEHVV